LPQTISNEEVAELYRQRWQIELFWKFLKMHLKLDRLISKSPNGITIQLYSCLIAYLILLLIEIPEIWGEKLLDKLRYLQGCMNQEFSYVHWIDRILHNRPFRLLMGASIGKCKVVLQLSTFLMSMLKPEPLQKSKVK